MKALNEFPLWSSDNARRQYIFTFLVDYLFFPNDKIGCATDVHIIDNNSSLQILIIILINNNYNINSQFTLETIIILSYKLKQKFKLRLYLYLINDRTDIYTVNL